MRPCGCNGDRGRHGRSCRLGLFKPPPTQGARMVAAAARLQRTIKPRGAELASAIRAVKLARQGDRQPPCGICPLKIGHVCSDGKLVL